jgi:hypothetical protein
MLSGQRKPQATPHLNGVYYEAMKYQQITRFDPNNQNTRFDQY